MPFEEGKGGDTPAIQEVKRRLSGFETEEGRKKGLSFRPRPDDILISTTPKAGTTWMQQICHQLRSGGNMDFDEISEVVPWIELAHDQGQNLDASQPGAPPRVFKTHCWYPHIPKGAKYIVVVRNPADVAVSFFRFFQGWFFQPGEVGMDEFVRQFWLERGEPRSEMQNASAFHHMLSWWPHRNDPHVLWVHFEDLKEDLKANVRRVANFIGVAADDQTIATAVTQSSYGFMSANSDKFNERLSKASRNIACGLAPDAGMGDSKVRRGKVGAAQSELSPELREAVQARWNEVMLPATGFETYEQLRAAVHEEQKN